MSDPTRLTRRALLQTGAAMVPLAISGCAATASSGTLRLRAKDPVARSLLYVENTSKVPDDHPLAATHTPEQRCANCIHLRGDAGEPWRPCPVFPGRLVNEDGWCSVWAEA
jgi:hypothetical protein